MVINLYRGVKQGDPLSPILFNLVLDELFCLLPPWIGAKVNLRSVNALAFADDIALTAETHAGMQELLRITSEFFRSRSMSINSGKCFSMRFMLSRKDRTTVLASSPTYQINGIDIPVSTMTPLLNTLVLNSTLTER